MGPLFVKSISIFVGVGLIIEYKICGGYRSIFTANTRLAAYVKSCQLNRDGEYRAAGNCYLQTSSQHPLAGYI